MRNIMKAYAVGTALISFGYFCVNAAANPGNGQGYMHANPNSNAFAAHSGYGGNAYGAGNGNGGGAYGAPHGGGAYSASNNGAAYGAMAGGGGIHGGMNQVMNIQLPPTLGAQGNLQTSIQLGNNINGYFHTLSFTHPDKCRYDRGLGDEKNGKDVGNDEKTKLPASCTNCGTEHGGKPPAVDKPPKIVFDHIKPDKCRYDRGLGDEKNGKDVGNDEKTKLPASCRNCGGTPGDGTPGDGPHGTPGHEKPAKGVLAGNRLPAFHASLPQFKSALLGAANPVPALAAVKDDDFKFVANFGANICSAMTLNRLKEPVQRMTDFLCNCKTQYIANSPRFAPRSNYGLARKNTNESASIDVINHLQPVALRQLPELIDDSRDKIVVNGSTHLLTSGAICVQPNQRMEVLSPDATIIVDTGACVLIRADEHGTRVFDLSDHKAGSVSVKFANDKIMTLYPGRELSILHGDGAEKHLFADGIGRRKLQVISMNDDKTIVASDFSIVEAIHRTPVLKQLKNSSAKEHKVLLSKLIKTAAAIAVVNGTM